MSISVYSQSIISPWQCPTNLADKHYNVISTTEFSQSDVRAPRTAIHTSLPTSQVSIPNQSQSSPVYLLPVRCTQQCACSQVNTTWVWSIFSHCHMTTCCMISCYGKPQTMTSTLSNWSCNVGFKLALLSSEFRIRWEYSKLETYITQSVARQWHHGLWFHGLASKSGNWSYIMLSYDHDQKWVIALRCTPSQKTTKGYTQAVRWALRCAPKQMGSKGYIQSVRWIVRGTPNQSDEH